MSQWSLWSFFWRDSKIVVSGKIIFPNGLLSDVKPYRELEATDPSLSMILREILLTDNVAKVRNFDVSELEDDIAFLRLLGVKSERELARKAKYLSVERNFERFDVMLFHGRPSGSFEGSPELSARIPKSMNLDDTVAVLIEEFTRTPST